LSVRPFHVHLDERASQFLLFPRRCRFASAQADGDILHPHRLPRFQGQVANDPVALVEQAEHRDALGHRSYAGLVARGPRHVDRDGLVALDLIALARPVAPCDHDKRQQREKGSISLHAWSGFHAS
jgi:hypothetical protein